MIYYSLPAITHIYYKNKKVHASKTVFCLFENQKIQNLGFSAVLTLASYAFVNSINLLVLFSCSFLNM